MSFWLPPLPLVLASRSVIRRTLLEAAGIPVEIIVADIDERRVERDAGKQSPSAAAALLARAKAAAVTAQRPGRLVLGADQTLDLDGERFSKPSGAAAARDQLARLRGRTHALHSAVAVARDDTVLFAATSTARLTMRAFSGEFLDRYVESAWAATSVGGYQLEGAGIHLFERIEGDHFTILGLPLLPLLAYLRRDGIVMG